MDEDKKPKIRLVSEILKSVKLANPPLVKVQSEHGEDHLRKEWMLNFLKKNGFEFSYSLFFKFQNSENNFSKNFFGFILKILQTFITAAFMASDPSLMQAMTLI